MPTWIVHGTYALWIAAAFLLGSFLPDIDHFRNNCSLITQDCKNKDRSLLFLHKFAFPFIIFAFGFGLLLKNPKNSKDCTIAFAVIAFSMAYFLHLLLDLSFYVQGSFI